MDLLSILLQLAFFVLFVATLWRFVRRRTRLDLAVVAIFASTAAIFSYALLNVLAPGQFTYLQPVAVTILLAQPVLVFWLVALIRRLPRWVVPLAVVGWIAATGSIVLAPPRFAPSLIFVALFFMAGEGTAALLLMREAQKRFGLHRIRLGLAGLATALFGASILIAALGSAATPVGVESPATAASRLIALLAAIGYLGAFAPPAWLRRLGQRAVAFDISRAQTLTPSGTEPRVLWSSLAAAARDILGAQAARVTNADQEILATTDEAAVWPAPDTRPARGTSRIVVPLRAPNQREARLEAQLDGQPLFIEEDLAVLSLLGSITVRAVEREEALVRLAEARQELQAAAEIRASEARFRALLAADPNSVLAVDGEGRISWATGPTAGLFGRPAHELAGLRIGDVIQLSTTDAGAGFGPDGDSSGSRVRRVEATARRNDGTTFPADVALTDFELDDRVFRLYVVSDATWRHEASLMRDRFLGILSHELRTPVTAIYGGTRLLLKKSSQLDPESRAELLESVATEADRLERIIENLLVMARVERGADFFETRPVALRAAMSELVSRERQLWPDLKIELAVEQGLPLVAADEDYLALIVRNLISNAAKYAGSTARVQITAGHEDDAVAVRFLDDGPGLPAESAEDLFNLYYRAPAASNTPGAGIGLFVCRGLVNAIGGRIWARQRPEGGAEFGFSVPLYRDPDEPAEPAESPLKSGPAQPEVALGSLST